MSLRIAALFLLQVDSACFHVQLSLFVFHNSIKLVFRLCVRSDSLSSFSFMLLKAIESWLKISSLEVVFFMQLLLHRRSQGGSERLWPPQIFRKHSHFVL